MKFPFLQALSFLLSLLLGYMVTTALFSFPPSAEEESRVIYEYETCLAAHNGNRVRCGYTDYLLTRSR